MKKGLLKKVLASCLALAMTFSIVACGNKEDKGTSSESKTALTEIKDKGELVVGLSADYAPYEFYTMVDGKKTIVGFDVELAKEIAKDLGVKLTLKEMKFDALLGALPAGQIDMIISGMNPDEERAKVIDFSDIYYTAQHGVLVNKKDLDKYKSVEDLKSARVGAQMGSTQADIIKEKIKADNPTLLANVNNLILELKSGKIDALVTEKPVAEMAIKNNNELALSKIEFKDETGGNAVAVKKGEKELVEQVNKTIKRLKDSGDLDKFIVDANELASKQIEK
ncbi:amino acid ABC transporter [Clostridium baratii]|uniref:Bacterial extracellular solute-binding s, 3 family protein n=1 Tax=Clostridium baratii str. Sullivan TaxID=1415775 RepID=A0A0A7FX17_9CLOT|nr:transporter substrate-binding domain-containing protein [Clostridium baratii]AIY84157.1 bacterial extracellular solute-binding s, 3 family protein [Clostridium baratii str. Sullivan]MBS6007172.1 transporter substrate-binding domain-containing protein [Clostridium baratii]MDU1054071.1 transporter substrate-binding domain-containing protein [Clostridium baratii]MDU1855383.1 transporter substrate-binding domain-containing protein [Clostridium baratii]OPF50603.1 amino acid ABC transporter [Clos